MSSALEPAGLHSKYEVARRGSPDPPGARHFVLDYVNDAAAYRAAHVFRNVTAVERSSVLTDALDESLAGGPEAPVLKTYQITRTDGQVREGARYLVLDYAHSYPARVAVSAYARAVECHNPVLASDLRAELADTQAHFREHVLASNPKPKSKRRRRS